MNTFVECENTQSQSRILAFLCGNEGYNLVVLALCAAKSNWLCSAGRLSCGGVIVDEAPQGLD